MERERSRIKGAVWIVAKGVRVLEDDDGGGGGDRGGGRCGQRFTRDGRPGEAAALSPSSEKKDWVEVHQVQAIGAKGSSHIPNT